MYSKQTSENNGYIFQINNKVCILATYIWQVIHI